MSHSSLLEPSTRQTCNRLVSTAGLSRCSALGLDVAWSRLTCMLTRLPPTPNGCWNSLTGLSNTWVCYALLLQRLCVKARQVSQYFIIAFGGINSPSTSTYDTCSNTRQYMLYTLLVYAGYMHIIIAYSCSQSVHHSNNLLDTGLMSLRGKRLPEYGLLC